MTTTYFYLNYIGSLLNYESRLNLQMCEYPCPSNTQLKVDFTQKKFYKYYDIFLLNYKQYEILHYYNYLPNSV